MDGRRIFPACDFMLRLARETSCLAPIAQEIPQQVLSQPEPVGMQLDAETSNKLVKLGVAEFKRPLH